MSHNDNPTVDFNLDAFSVEAEAKPFVVVHDGTPYQFTHLDLLDGWEAVEAFANNSATGDVDILRLALGDKFEDFKNAKRITRGGLQALVRRYLNHCGVETGN